MFNQEYTLYFTMKVIIDERETALYEKCDMIVNFEGNSTYARLFKKVLPLGDILITTDEDKPFCIIERKSLSDLLASIKDGRYEEQSHRLTHASKLVTHNIIYIIEGMMSQLKSIGEKRMVYSAITSLNFFKGFSVFRTSSLQETAEIIVWMADKIDRNFMAGTIPAYLRSSTINRMPLFPGGTNTNLLTNEVVSIDAGDGNNVTDNNNNTSTPDEDTIQMPPLPAHLQQENPSYSSFVKKVKRDNITPENIGEILLCQIPGISSVTAVAIMKQFKSFPKLLIEVEKNPDCLKNLSYETSGKTRKISKACIESIYKFLVDKPEPTLI